MAYVNGCGYDVFVSYAHVDDDPLAGAEEGWVSTLVKCVRAEVARSLGRREDYSLWMDCELRGSEPLTPQILSKVRDAAILLLVLSPGYLASRWCRQELAAFLKDAPERGAGHIFVAELDEIDDAERPDDLADLKGFRFWKRDRTGTRRRLGWPRPVYPQDQEYYNRVEDLARELAGALQELKRRPKPGPYTLSNFTRTIYLAQVTDDLDSDRDVMRRYLDQAGFNVVPATWYSQAPSAFREACQRDLARSETFVQLLSGIAGKKPMDLPQGYARLQLELAQGAGKPILQWRSPLLDLAAIQDHDHRTLLQAATVRAEPIEDFKREIERRLRQEKPAAASGRSGANAFVFVDMQSADRPLADQVCTIIGEYPMGVAQPLESGPPAEIERDLEENLSNCDALILVYGATPATWVRGRLRHCMKKLRQHLPALAIYEGPPEPKDPVGMMLPNMRVLDCRRGLNEPELRRFLDNIVARAG